MEKPSKRLALAQWMLERNLHWIAAAEVKVGVIIAINTAMLGALASSFGSASTHTAWQCLAATISFSSSVLAILSSAIAVLPRVTGPDSLIFFGRIASHTSPDFAQKFHNASDDELLEDCLKQVHRNAEIACIKFKCVRISMYFSFLALPFWVLAISLLAKL